MKTEQITPQLISYKLDGVLNQKLERLQFSRIFPYIHEYSELKRFSECLEILYWN